MLHFLTTLGYQYATALNAAGFASMAAVTFHLASFEEVWRPLGSHNQGQWLGTISNLDTGNAVLCGPVWT